MQKYRYKYLFILRSWLATENYAVEVMQEIKNYYTNQKLSRQHHRKFDLKVVGKNKSKTQKVN